MLSKDTKVSRFTVYTRYYGSDGLLLQVFGNSSVWKMQFQVLSSENPQTALDFKSANQQESSIVAIVGTILAQIAITAFSLDSLSHWTARGFFTFSLVASIISVYYASKQHNILGRCLKPEDIKACIRRKQPNPFNNVIDHGTDLPSVAAVLIIPAPKALLATAVSAFLVGLGIYLGFF
ncbi:hypothetical protein FQN49_002525 [Arthroderma sp. PD_2]|nr:hypothetical protein FQN49_002525 [Arthroderma sp. PD_2]